MQYFLSLLAMVVVCCGIDLARAASVGPAVTFETLPNGIDLPTDDMELDPTAEYELDNGVRLTFAFSNPVTQEYDGPGKFENRAGGRNQAEVGFASTYGTGRWDTGRSDAANARLGNFFLRSFEGLGSTDPDRINLKISYSNNSNMRYASGEIWDIDAAGGGLYEKWKVEAFSANGVSLDSICSPQGIHQGITPEMDEMQLDSAPWYFEITTNEDIAYVLITFEGDKQGGVGLAFNNFSTQITLPADFDEDGEVDGEDLTIWELAYGESADGDADFDSLSTGNDFLIWQRQFGKDVHSPQVNPIPEPASATLIGIGLMASLRRPSRGRKKTVLS